MFERLVGASRLVKREGRTSVEKQRLGSDRAVDKQTPDRDGKEAVEGKWQKELPQSKRRNPVLGNAKFESGETPYLNQFRVASSSTSESPTNFKTSDWTVSCKAVRLKLKKKSNPFSGFSCNRIQAWTDLSVWK